MHREPTTFSAESYFDTQSPPVTLQHDVQKVREFVGRQQKEGRNVVLVTSGGTTVPLELNIVRFLDNFSAGTRGATSAETSSKQDMQLSSCIGNSVYSLLAGIIPTLPIPSSISLKSSRRHPRIQIHRYPSLQRNVKIFWRY